VLYPKHEADLIAIFSLAAQTQFNPIYFAPRGGGTGTNGQSLTDGLVIDCSRHLANILELDLDAGWVRVQAGVIRDQLNDFLRPHGVFFAPTLSTSNRATLGGMASTDACGQGSRIYGRTSNHVLGLNLILASGTRVACESLSQQALAVKVAEGGEIAHLYQQVSELISHKQDVINARFPKLNRFMTGYNLAHACGDDGFDLSKLICGSEGTLAVVSELTLKLTPLPKVKELLVVSYPSFDAALRDANLLVQQNPDAIETIDDTILSLAEQDVIWPKVSQYVSSSGTQKVAAINLIEYSAMGADELAHKMLKVCHELDIAAAQYQRISCKTGMSDLWELRKKGVGLLGNLPGLRRPVAFVEDTAVPPEHLADYIVEFRQLLDGMGVTYGMFGHVDAGCLHVRPALNMRDPQDAIKLRVLSDAVQALVQKYQGVMWGEHGKGFRSEYTEATIGAELYQDMRRIKGWFDPYNQLNPGKICSPLNVDNELVQVDDPRTRGGQDRQIGESVVEQWQPVVSCNGNGACFDYHKETVMCPSYKATGDRVQSPKGRASLLREWLRQEENGGADPVFATQVYAAMVSCLACKGCTTACPIKVDIPTYRSRFFQRYFSQNRRPLADYAIAMVEHFAMASAYVPNLMNGLLNQNWINRLIEKYFGLVRMPQVFPYTHRTLAGIKGVKLWHKAAFNTLSTAQKQNHIVIVQDVFSSCYDLPQVTQILSGLVHMGFTPLIMPLQASAKPLYVKGFLRAFKFQAKRVSKSLLAVQQQGFALVAIDPSVGLTYRDEYRQLVTKERVPKVLLLQEWLVPALVAKKGSIKRKLNSQPVTLLSHCSETAMVADNKNLWQQVFKLHGIELKIPAVGCCGMAGTFGHEAKHQTISNTLYQQSWKKPVDASLAQGLPVLATGYSCRSQIGYQVLDPQRLNANHTMHPLAYLNQLFNAAEG